MSLYRSRRSRIAVIFSARFYSAAHARAAAHTSEIRRSTTTFCREQAQHFCPVPGEILRGRMVRWRLFVTWQTRLHKPDFDFSRAGC
jgi:hypothetical protein